MILECDIGINFFKINFLSINLNQCSASLTNIKALISFFYFFIRTDPKFISKYEWSYMMSMCTVCIHVGRMRSWEHG